MICMLFSHATRANPITRRACRRSEMPTGMSDLRGAARFSAYSRMSVESISTVPSSHTSEGALTTGLIRRNCSKVLKTEIDRCSNGRPSNWSDTATRRTYGESSIPMSCINPRADGSRALAQEDVGRTFARDALRAFIAQSTHIDVVQEMLPGTEQDRPDGEMQFVDQGGAQILPNGGYAATEAHVAAARCIARLLQSGVNAFGDEAKLRTSRHPERRPRVMRQHEDGRVIRRLVAPPALPAVVRPRAPDRTEHVAPENPSTDSGKALLGNPVVDPCLSTVMALHLPPHARGEEPLHQLRAPDAERILEILVRPSTVAVDGNREALDAEFRHYIPQCGVRPGLC